MIFWGLAAAVPAIIAEYLYRTLQGSWWTHLYLWIPLQLSVGYGVYRLVTGSSTLMDAFVIWSVSTVVLRAILSVVILGDTVSIGTWAAIVLVLLAKGVQGIWK